MGHNDDDHSMNRRDFLKLGIVGATTAAVGLSGISGFAEAAAPNPGPVYRTLGRTGLKLTVVSFGAMLTPEYEVMEVAFDQGVNYVDTARRYMNGRNEDIVGRALKGRRDKVYVATKTQPASQSKKDLFHDVEVSLSKLQTDHIDVIQLHNLERKDRIFIPETREALLELRKQGKVRFFGITTHTNQAEVVNALVDDKDKFFDTALVAYNFKSDPAIKEAIARAAKAGIGIIAMKTQAGGYKTDALGPVSPHQAALKWVLQDPNVTTAIPGMKSMDHIRELTAVMGMKLTRADERILNRYGEAIAPYYCHLCGSCESTCPQNVAISVINRSIMYAESYGSMALAKQTYDEIGDNVTASACMNCTKCTAQCANGLDIAAKMRKARTLLRNMENMLVAKRKTGVRGLLSVFTLAVLLVALFMSTPANGQNPPESPLPSQGFLEGWIMEGKVNTYTPENLYTHINGEAELYLPYGFQLSWAALYVKKDDPKSGLAVDVYRMGSLLDAFGIYSNYRSPDYEEVRVGTEGFVNDSQLLFYKDRYFVQLAASGESVPDRKVFTALAEGIAGKLSGSSTPPKELDLLRVEGMVPRTEKYVAQSLLGYGFLKRGFTATALVDGLPVKVFIALGESTGPSAETLEKYLRYLKEGGAQPEMKKDGNTVTLIGRDPLYKGMVLRQSGRYLLGAVNLKDPLRAMPLMDRLQSRTR